MSGQTIALPVFLILLAIGSIIVLSIFIVIKRSITRRKSRIGRIAYTSVGNGCPKFWKESINAKINATVKIRVEPRVFPSPEKGQSDTPERNLGFQFRAKTVDLFADIKERILAVCPHLEAPPVRGINDFLTNASSQAMSPKPDRKLVGTYCDLYNRARYDPGAYTDVDYLRFLEIHDQLLKAVVVKEIRTSESPKSAKRSHKRTKAPPNPKTRQPPHSEFVEMKPSTSGTNAIGEAILRTPLSRSGSAASDDSQTALIRLDDGRNTSSHLRQ